jgi:predicted short-subunit dehydrogenase-like oxidoreductase (DUF2520 family)
VGRSLARAAEATELEVTVHGREGLPADATHHAVLLCVPDGEIEAACTSIPEPTPRYVGHVSGATPLASLVPATTRGAEVFSLHPLQTIPHPETDLTGAPCAVSGSSPEALEFAETLAERLGLRPFAIDEDARTAYHAAASIASNFLVALEESAAELLERSGIEDPHELLAPLVLRTALNWSEQGRDALTGPIARGDEETVERHLAELAERAPQLVPLYTVLAERTRALATEKAASR